MVGCFLIAETLGGRYVEGMRILGSLVFLSICSCSSVFVKDSPLSVYESQESDRHSHGSFVHIHTRVGEREHFHPQQKWDISRSIAEDKRRKLEKERQRRRFTMRNRPLL
ncbi:hypothetical protein [Rubritalea tangerina]|uniref:hypothetical protein n=1 Tax=Rubritalea tangerina TaxID=430798 RepID=UPI0036082234